MSDKKIERFSELLKEEISSIIMKEVMNPEVGFVTITRVEPTKDFRQATVFFTTYPEDKEEEVKRALESASGFISRLLRKRIRAKAIPSLRFEVDRELKTLEKYWEWQSGKDEG